MVLTHTLVEVPAGGSGCATEVRVDPPHGHVAVSGSALVLNRHDRTADLVRVHDGPAAGEEYGSWIFQISACQASTLDHKVRLRLSILSVPLDRVGTT